MIHIIVYLFLIVNESLLYSQLNDVQLSEGILIVGNQKTGISYAFNLKDIHVSKKAPKVKEKLGSYRIKERGGNLLKPSNIRQLSSGVSVESKEGAVFFYIDSLKEGSQKLIIVSNDFKQVTIPIIRQKDEKLRGGGIQFSEFNNQEREFVHISQENGIGRGGGSISKWSKLLGVRGEASATYCPFGFYETNLGRWFEIKGNQLHILDIDTDEYKISLFGDTNQFVLGFEESNRVDELPYKLPDWSLGTILGLQGGSEEVLNKLNKVLDKDGTVEAVWIQDWAGKRKTSIGSRLNWTWQLDTTVYSDFNVFKSYLNDRNIKLLGYINPFFAEEGKYIMEGIAKGYFIKKKNNDARLFNYGGMKGYMLDIFNPEAYNWMKQIRKEKLIGNGFDGWMADFAEWYPVDQHHVLSDIEKHNQYPVLWNKLNYEVVKESRKEIFFFNRSGGNETAKYSSMMWLGDQMVDYTCEDGLCSVFDGYLSAADAGLPPVHSDVGGYTGVKKPIIKNLIRSEDVLIDWMVLEAFTPIFRSHEGLLPDDFVQVYDEELVDHYIDFSNINRGLRPYFKELIDLREKGVATFQPINDSIIPREKYEKGFMVGDEIIILFNDNLDEIIKGYVFPNTLRRWFYHNRKVSVFIKENGRVEELLKNKD